MIIQVFNRQKALRLFSKQIRLLVRQVLQEEGVSCDEVSIYFINDEAMRQLHADFFNDPSPTDCISFPLDSDDTEDDYRILGEIFVCPETAIQYARDHQVDPYEEATLYIVHGLLHLMGYDDMTEEDIQEMRSAESRHLQELKMKQLILKPLT